ncbi:MAG: hypothetical protein K2M75_04355 [Clostridia bacterium]|nr:hypothetical protein [Clostridia bacterium]
MNDKDFEDNIKILALGLRSGESVGVMPNIDLYLRKIKKAYKIVVKKVSENQPLYESERWLYENYYATTIDVKQSDYRVFSKLTHKKNNVRIIQLARFLVSSNNCCLNKEYIAKGIALFNSYTPLHYEETLNLKKALDYALIEKIAVIATQITQMEKLKRHAQRDAEPVRRLCKYDAYLYFFKHFGKYLDEKYFYKINDINLDNIDVSFSNNLVDMSVIVSNCITSIKALVDIFDDKFIIEQCSIYSIMAQDEIFKEMDICSQYAYMSAIGKLSTLYGASERSVAKSAMKLGKKFGVHFGEIIYDYRYAIKADLHSYSPQILQKPTTRPDQRLYATVVALLSMALTTLSVVFLPTWRLMVGVGVIMFFASLPLARFVVALIVDNILPSRSVASMNYKDLPQEGRTLVVKCEYIASAKQAKEACDNLLNLAMTNKDAMLEYSLLVDLKSSKSQVDEIDGEIYKVFDELSKYDNVNVFVRKRQNSDGVWKAFERKRGATNALNSALISGNWQDFCYMLKKQQKPNFVLLLDEDNTLMPGGIKRAVNTMLHPLNAKYTLLTFSSRYKLSSLTTPWTKRYSLDSGVDSYCNYGDFYYKISGNAIYCGKGIYRLDEYVDKLQGKLPDGKILSHDIVEGAIVSAGSLSVPTYEDAPTGFVSHIVRQNRWQRGDILLFPYIFSKKITQPFYKYVMAFNIVKTILPICQFILLSTLILTGQLWLLLPFAISFVGIYLIRFGLCLNALKYGKRMRYVLCQFAGEVGEMVYDFLTLPFEAVQSVLLWLKMIFKLIFDRKNLLEWKTFYSTQRGNTFSKHIGVVLPSCILSIVLAGIFFGNIAFLAYISAFVVFILVIYTLGIKTDGAQELKPDEEKFIRKLADDTLQYFERNMQGKSLICDNYQVFPKRGSNSFTSPTNIGFSLLSIICAHKLEKIPQEVAIQRLGDQIDIIEGLEKYEGHLYNWYSLATQKPLYPYFVSSVDSGNFIACLITVKAYVKDIDEKLYNRVVKIIADCDFDALFDNSKGKFYIGYNKEQNKFEGHYDMLASEARTLCYIASCLNGNTAYFNGLARNIVKLKGNTLVSWSGTAFEYLMPQIFLSDCKGSLLTKSCNNIIDIMAKSKCGDVWGISESCYFEFNEENSYKYSAFGVSSISLNAVKDRCVISPYASALTLKYSPAKAIKNLRKLADMGMQTSMGMYEAIDFTNGANIVATLMSHHQGMLLCSIVNTLFDDYLVKLFMSDHAMSGGKLMLEEKIPTSKSKSTKKFDAVYDAKTSNGYCRAGDSEGFPVVNALTNGHYSVVCNSHGGGYSFAKGKYIDKFSSDIYDNKGCFFYINDGKEIYCPTYAPMYKHKCQYDFSPYESKYINIEKHCQMSIYIPQHINCEVRKVTITNNDDTVKKYSCGLCGELALNDFGGMVSHPAFNDMFISTSYDDRLDSLIAKRTSRSFHGDCYASLTVLGVENLKYESNLSNFVGREGSFDSPNIFNEDKKSGVSVGDVLNPCLGFVGEITLNPGESKTVYCIIAYDGDLNALKSNIEQAKSTDFAKYAYESAKLTALSKTYKYQLNDKISDLICRLSTNVLYAPYDRQKLSEISNNFAQALPMSLDKATKYIYFGYHNQDEKLKTLIYSVIYMNMASIKCNLVVAYCAKEKDREHALKNFIDLTNIGDLLNLNCLRFLNIEGMDEGVIDEIKLGAFIVLDSVPKKGEKNEESFDSVKIPILEKGERVSKNSVIFSPLNANIVKPCSAGGFDEEGNYVITSKPDLPYSNVICGEKGGFVVTQNGGGFDYFDNSNLNRVTKFENNPVFDTPCEELYVEIDGNMQRLNRLVKGGYVKHGLGYTQFCGIVNQVKYCVEEGIIKDGRGKYVKIKLSKEKLNIDTQALFAIKAMLGDLPINQMLFDEQVDNRTIKITNAYNNQSVFVRCDVEANLLPSKASFKTLGGEVYVSESKVSCNLASHALLTRKLSGREIEINFVIAKEYEFLASLKFDNLNDYIVEQKYKFADLNKFELRSKDKNLNLLFNKWLAYQVVSSRINGKCGYYQAGGAIGFRDQLQDMLTMLYIDTERVKNHILLSAEHQYLEGDVQHWWHGDCFGVRTHITDDRLFLPLLTFEYIDFTGDNLILTSIQKYLVSTPLEDMAESRLEVPQKSQVGESLLSHIKRAIDATLRYGERGLLLIGGGDWNDALNEIGMQNKGESVWLSMITLHVLRKFVKYLDFDRRQEYLAHIENLQLALDKCFKDGYFMRATTDYGEELGVKGNQRFTKDILCQSWSVIASVSSKGIQNQALQNVSDLIDCNAGIIKLLGPAQTKDSYYGYISAYPKGVRENGGQYTHASAWYVKAVAMADIKIDTDSGKYSAHDLLNMINPIAKNSTEEGANMYKGEPYVLAGDVYSNQDNYGRMGWSWYSGSASILYDTIVRDFIGITIQGKIMSFTRPKLDGWQGMSVTYKHKGTVYLIEFDEGKEDCIELQGVKIKGDTAIAFEDNAGKKQVKVIFAVNRNLNEL